MRSVRMATTRFIVFLTCELHTRIRHSHSEEGDNLPQIWVTPWRRRWAAARRTDNSQDPETVVHFATQFLPLIGGHTQTHRHTVSSFSMNRLPTGLSSKTYASMTTIPNFFIFSTHSSYLSLKPGTPGHWFSPQRTLDLSGLDTGL